MEVPVEYGRDLLPDVLPENREWLAVTAPPVAEKLGDRMQTFGDRIYHVPGMDEEILAAWERELPEADAVVGIGGGVCMDAAKYIAWRREIPLWLAPSIVSSRSM